MIYMQQNQPPAYIYCQSHPLVTVDHILFHCIRYEDYRNTYLKIITNALYLHPKYAEYLLNFLPDENILKLLGPILTLSSTHFTKFQKNMRSFQFL